MKERLNNMDMKVGLHVSHEEDGEAHTAVPVVEADPAAMIQVTCHLQVAL